MRRSLPLLVLFLLSALPAAAQHPNVERGFAPGQSFQIGDVDHVNLFNGSLVLTIPIGQSYPVGGGLSYGLTLTYSSNVWDFRLFDAGEVPQPSRTSNAGLGWRVSLGRYYAWNHPDNDRQKDLYVSPDGTEHWFYEKLHAGDADDPGDGPQPYQQSVWYSRDGSYLRARKLAAGWSVEFPNGQVHTFDASGRLTKIADRFTNQLSVSYGAGLWTLTDNHNRTQRIYFQSLSQGGNPVEMVDRIELAAFGGTTAVYDFSYTRATVRRACMTQGILSNTTTVQLLSGVSLPDGSSYQMPGYVTDPSTSAAGCRASGALNTLVLPTLARLEWTWQPYMFPTGSAPHAPPWQYSAGVASRAVRLPTGVLQGVWNYQTSLTPAGTFGQERELVNTVTDPPGHRTVNYFSVDPESAASGWSVHDYGLPFTRFADDGAGRFLSTRVYNASGQLLRSTYARYEADQRWASAELQDKSNLNRREASQRTVYDDGVSADVTHSQFDGLGHYRRSETAGTFGSGDQRVQWVYYNPGAGTYELDANGAPKPGFTMIPAWNPWILGLYWDRSVTEGGSGDQDLSCFDGATGFLLGRRSLEVPGQLSATDLLAVYEKDAAGNVKAETFYGGDSGGLSTTDPNPCGSLPAASQYRLVHEWDFGSLTTSKYDTAPFFSVKRTIDPSTCLPSADFDTADLKTSYEYDAMGRRTWEMPAAGQGGWTEFVYSRAVSASDLADVLIRRRANGSKSAAVLSQSQILFDALGRVWREQRKLPGGSWSVRETLYDGAGNKASVSEEQTGNPTAVTRFLGYDPFGRPGTIRPPDGTGHDVTLAYNGVRTVVRTVKIGTAYNAGTGAVTESSAATTETYAGRGGCGRSPSLPAPPAPTSPPPTATTAATACAASRPRREP